MEHAQSVGRVIVQPDFRSSWLTIFYGRTLAVVHIDLCHLAFLNYYARVAGFQQKPNLVRLQYSIILERRLYDKP